MNDNKVKAALNARQLRINNQKSQITPQEKKVNSALKLREERVKNNLQNTLSNLNKRINDELTAAENIASPSFGKDSLKNSLEATRQNTINIENIKKEVLANQKHLGDVNTSKIIDTLNQLDNIYSNNLKLAEFREQFNSEDEYNYYKKINDINNMSSDELQNYLNEDNEIAYTTTDGKNVTWQSLYDRKKFDEDLANQIDTAKSDSEYEALVNEGNALDGKTVWGLPVVGENKIASYRGEVGFLISANALRAGGKSDENISLASYMTEDEANLYSYYLMKNGVENADNYFDSLKPILKERMYGKLSELATDFANEYPILSSLTSVGLNLASSGEYITDIFNSVIDPENSDMRSQTSMISNTIRNTVANKVDWSIGDFDTFDFIYNTGMSMADSMLAGVAFGGNAGGISLALSAAAQSTNDALDRGMSKSQAVTNGIFSGVFEGLFESVSLGNLESMKEIAKYSLKDISKNITKSMLVNASEEALTEVSNIIYDTVINGDFSNYQTTIKMYLNQGMSEEEAKRKAALDLGAQIGEAVASGGFMGIGFSSVGNAASRINNAKQAKLIYGNLQSDLVRESLEIDPNNAFAQRMQTKLDNKKNLSGSQLVKLTNHNEQTIIKKNKQLLIPSIKDKLTEHGETTNVTMLSGIIAKEITGEELTSRETKILNRNKNAQEVLNEILPDGIDKSEFNRNLYKSSIEYSGKQTDISTEESENFAAETTKKQNLTESLPENKTGSEVKNTDLYNIEATLNGETVIVKEISSIDNGNVKLRISDGCEVNADSLEFENSQDRFLYKTLAKIGIDAEGANRLIKGYISGAELSKEDYALGIEKSFEAGKYSLPTREVLANEYANKLTEEQRALAYVLGQNSAKAQTSAKQATIDNKKTNNTKKNKQGKVHYNKMKTLSERQKVSIEALEKIADALGIQFYLFESEVDKNGRRIGKNGWFDPEDGSIHIDLFAGIEGKGTILFTASHELTHFIREWSPAKFKIFADFVMKQYGKSDELVTDLISEQIKKAKENGREINFDTAYEETIAASCEAILTDSNAISKIAELKAKDKKLWEKIKDYFTELLSKIKKVYNKLLPDSQEGKFVKGIMTEVEKLQELWTNALVDAAKSFSYSETIEDSSSIKKYSFREYTDKQKENWKDSKRIILYDNDIQFKEFINNARNDKEYNKKMYFGSITSELAELIYKNTGINVENFNCSLSAYEIKKIFKDHGTEEKEAPRGQRAITENDIINIPNVILSPEKIKLSPKLYQGKPVIEFSKQFNGTLNVAAVVSDKHLDLFVQTSYVGIKKGNFSLPISEQALINTPEANKDTVSINSVSQDSDSVKKKFSDRDPEAIERMEKINEILKEENEQLKQDIFRLEELVKLQRDVTTFTQTSVDAAAKYLMNISYAKGNKKEFAKILDEFYNFIAASKELTWYNISERAQPAIDWLQEHTKVTNQISEEAREILDNIKGSRIYLDDMQKSEVSEIYESYDSYRKKLFGTIYLTDRNSISLDSKWQEWAELYPNYFDKNTNSNDMPSRLLDIIAALRKPENTAFENEYVRELAEQELLQQIYDSYWRVSTLHVPADKIGAKVNALKNKHNQAIEKLKDEHRKNDAELKKLRKGKLGEIRIEQKTIALRHKISNIVYDLNRNLFKGGKKSNIPETFHAVVAKTLDIVDVDLHPLKPDEQIKRIKERIPYAKDKETERKMWNRIKNIENEIPTRKELKAAYKSLQKNADPDVARMYDENVDKAIEQVQTIIGDTPLHSMNLEQLQLVYDMYSMLRTCIAKYNKNIRDSKVSEIEKDAQKIESELKVFDDGKNIQSLSKRNIEEYLTEKTLYDNLKPETAFEFIGSKTLTRYYHNIRAGEDIWAKDVTAAKQFCQEKMDAYNFKNWDLKKTYKYSTASGEELMLNLEHLLSIYAYSRRDAAKKHLLEGGITLNDRTILYVDGKKKVTKKKTTYKIGEDILNAISKDLTTQQKEFVVEMQTYLSLVMGQKGNEVSRKMYGIKLFNEENYFPMVVDGVFMPRSGIESNTVRWLVDKGFTNQTQKDANNAIILTPFMDTWAGHINEMSMYHAFVIPLDAFKRVYNYNQKASETEDPKSIRQKIINAHGKPAVNYIDQLLKDINGGIRSDPRENLAKKLVSLHKKISVSGSISVVIQQPTSAVRAMALINPKYFLINKNAKLGKQNHKESWDEIKKYAPVAIIKEMGRFDTGMGQSTIDWIKNKNTFMDKVDDVTSLLPSKADEMAWVNIWKAVKRETVLNHINIAYGSEKFFEIVGKRFTEIITKTQVYDSVFTRSANMRSKGVMMNMLTSFMGEPTTVFNMVSNAITEWRREGKSGGKRATQTLASVFGSVILNSAMVALWYAARDDDEDETYIEKYLSSFASEMIDGINPLTYIPLVRDFNSILLGYDIERSDMTMIDDSFDAIIKLSKLMSKDIEDMDESELEDYTYSVVDGWLSAAANILSFSGFSIKNLYKEGKTIVNLFDTVKKDLKGRETTALSLGDAVMNSVKKTLPILASQPEKKKRDKMYDAIIQEDEAYEKRLISSYKNLKSAQAAIRTVLKEHFIEGDIDNEKTLELLIGHGGLNKEAAEKKMMHWIFENQYPYYDLSEAAVYKYENNIKDSGISMDIYYEYYTKKKDCVGSDEDGNGEIDSGSRKKKILDIINSLPITKKQKDALYYSEGWEESTINDTPWN